MGDSDLVYIHVDAVLYTSIPQLPTNQKTFVIRRRRGRGRRRRRRKRRRRKRRPLQQMNFDVREL